jgi:hypothetical protein
MQFFDGIRWKRVVLYGLLAEILIIPGFAVLVGSGQLLAAQYAVMPLSFLATLLCGWLCARRTTKRVLHGTLTGLSAYLFYLIVFPAIGWLVQTVGGFTPPEDVTTPPPPLIYPIANVLKVAGGAVGGWIAARKV